MWRSQQGQTGRAQVRQSTGQGVLFTSGMPIAAQAWSWQAVTVTIDGQPLTAPAIAAGDNLLCSCDGANVRAAGAPPDDPEAAVYDFGFAFGDAPEAGAVIQRVRIGRAITIPADMAGSAGGVAVNPDAQFDVDVQDDGVSIGTISVSTAGAVTFSTDGGTAKSVAAGSEIAFIAPAGVGSPPVGEASTAGGSFVILATID